MLTRTFEVDYPGHPRITVTVSSTDPDWRPAVWRAIRRNGWDPALVTACCQVSNRKRKDRP